MTRQGARVFATGISRAGQMVLERIEGGGHAWPSGIQYLPEGAVGRVAEEIDGAVEAWHSFRDFE